MTSDIAASVGFSSPLRSIMKRMSARMLSNRNLPTERDTQNVTNLGASATEAGCSSRHNLPER